MNAKAITDAVNSVTKAWGKQRKAEERDHNRACRRREALTRSCRWTIRDAAWEVMREAYLKASSGSTLPAHARQIMYAARGPIQTKTSRSLDDAYFTQTLLPDYMSEHPDETADWDVVFDARGHFSEPHTRRIVPLGTMDVRQYLKDADVADDPEDEEVDDNDGLFPTHGARNRFSAVLFVEKEGFGPLFKEVRLAERFDIAIMSTKGMSVTASRSLVDTLCARHSIPLLVLHDFDKSGFSIVGTLDRDTRRYEFTNEIEVIDLGLRLEDVKQWGLQAEDVSYGRSHPKWNLHENGATPEEIEFLCPAGQDDPCCAFQGRRVELNAFTSGDLIKWIEAKLKKHGIRKVVPDRDTLEAAYRRALEAGIFRQRSEEIRAAVRLETQAEKPPKSLERQVRALLKAQPAMPWDKAIKELVNV